MVITWYGQSCFKLQSGELVGVIDPFGKEIGLTPPRFRADFLLITHPHFDHANKDTIPESPFCIEGPGEYEVKGVTVRGIQTYHDASEGKERGLNTIYMIEMEGIKICHLGDFGEKEIRDETLEKIGDVDILLVPVGGHYTTDGEEAAKVVNKIEPRIVIPMHYKISGLKVNLDSAEKFLKEMGAKGVDAEEKLVIKEKDLPQEETRVIVLRTP
ncbi:MAG: MBL fold metallo-hydrolase [bacterium]|nr:MBL fold metallo-hydrolase [bacterium]